MLPDLHLDALDGISYVTHLDGTIGGVGPTRWNAFAAENGAPELLEDAVVGRNLFEFISGEDVQSHLRRIMKELSARIRPNCVVPFRCDAPDRRRNMRQSITGVFAGSECRAFLFQSIELDSQQRPPIDLYDFKALTKRALAESGLPLIAMCSWCQRVRAATVTQNRWVTAEDYYAAGGRSDVQISHGICETCAEDVHARLV